MIDNYGDNMVVKQKSVMLDDQVIEQIRLIAFKKKISQSELIRKYIDKGLKEDLQQTKIDEFWKKQEWIMIIELIKNRWDKEDGMNIFNIKVIT